jgi:hypothetical protein
LGRNVTNPAHSGHTRLDIVPVRGTWGSPEERLPACRRRARRVTSWLLVRGTAASPLAPAVDPGGLVRHSSTRRPAVQAGDSAVLYAAVWQAVFAVAEVTGPPEHDPARTRWAWSFPLRPLVAVESLEEAPPVEAAGVFPQSLWRHSHVRLTDEQFSAAQELITSAAVRPPAGRGQRSSPPSARLQP